MLRFTWCELCTEKCCQAVCESCVEMRWIMSEAVEIGTLVSKRFCGEKIRIFNLAPNSLLLPEWVSVCVCSSICPPLGLLCFRYSGTVRRQWHGMAWHGVEVKNILYCTVHPIQYQYILTLSYNWRHSLTHSPMVSDSPAFASAPAVSPLSTSAWGLLGSRRDHGSSIPVTRSH